MLATATLPVAPRRHGRHAEAAPTTGDAAAVEPITPRGLARSLRRSFRRAGDCNELCSVRVALSSKAASCPLPAARSQPLRRHAVRSAHAATAARRRSFASASVPCRSAPPRRASRAGWRSASRSTPHGSSTSSAGRATTSSRLCAPADAHGRHAHPSSRDRAADVEIERLRSQPAGRARCPRAAPARAQQPVGRASPAVAFHPSRSITLRAKKISGAEPDAIQ